jgi:hypothetical protein
LGVEFPGITYTENDTPNWVREPHDTYTVETTDFQVGHLINQYYRSKPLVYDYAVGGHTIKELPQQIERFKLGPGRKSRDVPWTPSNSLFGMQ